MWHQTKYRMSSWLMLLKCHVNSSQFLKFYQSSLAPQYSKVMKMYFFMPWIKFTRLVHYALNIFLTFQMKNQIIKSNILSLKRLLGNRRLQPIILLALGIYTLSREAHPCPSLFPPHTHDEKEFKNLMGFSENVLCNEFFEIFFMIMSILKVRKTLLLKKDDNVFCRTLAHLHPKRFISQLLLVYSE